MVEQVGLLEGESVNTVVLVQEGSAQLSVGAIFVPDVELT